MCWWFVYFEFWNSLLGVAPCTSCPDQVELYSLSTLFLELLHARVSLCYQNIFLSTHLRISDFWLWSGLHKFPCCYFHFFSFIGILRIDQILQILWRVFLAPWAAWYLVDVSRLRGYHRLWFCHQWAFTWSRLLTAFWRGAPLSDRIRKKITDMATREHREIHDVQQTKKMIPFVTRKNFLLLGCRRVGFWCQHSWFGFLLLTWSCRTTNQAQICGFWTRVSLLDFVLWWSSWSQLRYLQRCTTETCLEKNVSLWERSPHLTIDQHLRCFFQLVFWSWFYCSNGFLSRTGFRELAWLFSWFCLSNATLQLPHPRGREQEVHPFAVQHPTKWFQIL